MLAVLKAQFRIERLCSAVMAGNFEMNCMNAEFSSSLFDELHRLSSPAFAAVTFEEEELVDEGVSPEEFETVAECEDNVANFGFPCTDKPDQAERRISQ